MKTIPLRFGLAAAVMLVVAPPAFAESATMGWQAVQRGELPGPESGYISYVAKVHMLGPTMRNKSPQKKGTFKGEYLSGGGDKQSRLVSIYKLSLDKKGELQSRKIDFRMLPATDADGVELHGYKVFKATFETSSISFEPGETFVLIFKNSAALKHYNQETEMVVLRITYLFVPS